MNLTNQVPRLNRITVLSLVAYLTLHNVLKVYPSYGMCQNFLLRMNSVSHGLAMPRFVYLSRDENLDFQQIHRISDNSDDTQIWGPELSSD